MNGRQHRFRLGRRHARPVSTDHLESVLSQPIETESVDASFEDAVLGRVAAHRPFLAEPERRRVRWVRMSVIGLALGLFATGAIGIRAGLLPFGEQAGPVSSIVESAQSEGIQQVQSVALWRDEALAKFESIKEHQRRARNNAPIRCQDARVITADHAHKAAAYEQGVCIGLSMREPVSAISQVSSTSTTRLIVFDDGLAVPIAGNSTRTSGLQQVQIKRWPSTVQDSIMNIGLEGSSELTLPGVLPPWYSSDVVRLPDIQAGPAPIELPR